MRVIYKGQGTAGNIFIRDYRKAFALRDILRKRGFVAHCLAGQF